MLSTWNTILQLNAAFSHNFKPNRCAVCSISFSCKHLRPSQKSWTYTEKDLHPGGAILTIYLTPEGPWWFCVGGKGVEYRCMQDISWKQCTIFLNAIYNQRFVCVFPNTDRVPGASHPGTPVGVCLIIQFTFFFCHFFLLPFSICSHLKCRSCNCVVGKVIHAAPSHLAAVRSLFLLDKTKMSWWAEVCLPNTQLLIVVPDCNFLIAQFLTFSALKMSSPKLDVGLFDLSQNWFGSLYPSFKHLKT